MIGIQVKERNAEFGGRVLIVVCATLCREAPTQVSRFSQCFFDSHLLLNQGLPPASYSD